MANGDEHHLDYHSITEHPSFQRLTLVLRAAQLSGFMVDFTGVKTDGGVSHGLLAQQIHDVQQRLLQTVRSEMTTAVGVNRAAESVHELFTLLAQTGYAGWEVPAEDVLWCTTLMRSTSPVDAWGLRGALLAFGSSMTLLLTPAETAILMGEGESTWRKRILAGEVIGAFKKGKQWLIQAESLRLLGYEVPTPSENAYSRRESEVLRLKQISGLAELFAEREFSEAWEVVTDTD